MQQHNLSEAKCTGCPTSGRRCRKWVFTTAGGLIMRAFLFLLSMTAFASAQPKALFYMIETPNSVKSFTAHADKIDILVPAWYQVDGNGLVWGGPNAQVLQAAAERHVPVMPIVALMTQLELHKLLTTEASKLALTNALLSECKKNGYAGFQIDFENVN